MKTSVAEKCGVRHGRGRGTRKGEGRNKTRKSKARDHNGSTTIGVGEGTDNGRGGRRRECLMDGANLIHFFVCSKKSTRRRETILTLPKNPSFEKEKQRTQKLT